METTYEYYNAYDPEGREKSGINRIVYVNGIEITREYLEKRPENIVIKNENKIINFFKNLFK